MMHPHSDALKVPNQDLRISYKILGFDNVFSQAVSAKKLQLRKFYQ